MRLAAARDEEHRRLLLTAQLLLFRASPALPSRGSYPPRGLEILLDLIAKLPSVLRVGSLRGGAMVVSGTSSSSSGSGGGCGGSRGGGGGDALPLSRDPQLFPQPGQVGLEAL